MDNDDIERGERRYGSGSAATEDTASACCGAQLLASMRSSRHSPDSAGSQSREDPALQGSLGGEAHAEPPTGIEPRSTSLGKAQLTADKERLATGIPKYEYMMTANLARQRSADESLWQQFTEPEWLPAHVDAKASETTAPYQEEVVCKSKTARCRSVFGLPMLRPESRTAKIWSFLMKTCDVTYTAFLVPLSFAFFHDVRMFNWMSVLDIVGGVMYVLDVLCAFHIGVVFTKSMHARLVLDGRLVAHFYIRHSTFFFDILAAFPVFPEVALLSMSTSGDKLKTFSDVVAWMRLVRMLRLLPLLRGLAVLSLTGHYNRRLLAYIPSSTLLFVHITYMFLFLANLLSCVWYYTADAQGLSSSWLTSVGSNSADLTASSGVSKYIASFYYVTTFLSTVGFGDVTATTTAERVVATVMMVIGIAFFSFLLGVMQTLIQRGSVSGRRADMYRERIGEVEAWMNYSEMPGDLRRKIRAYYAEVWVRHEEVDEEEMFRQLPYYLRGQVASFLTDDMLRKSHAFGNLDTSARQLVAAMLQPVPLAPGHTLFSQGQPADCIYILQDGEVAAYRNTGEIERISAPFLIGELSILNFFEPLGEMPHRHHFAIRGLTLCMIWELKLSDLRPLLNIQPQLTSDLVEDLCGIMQRLHDQQPEEKCWRHNLHEAEKRLAELTGTASRDANGEPPPLPQQQLARRRKPVL